MDRKKWLPHVTNDITIGSRNRLSAYLIALEGWRRGLKLTWYSKKVKNNKVHAPGRYFSLSTPNKIHYFYNSRGDLTKGQAQKITGNKHSTKKYLSEAGISNPQGEMFNEKDADETIIKYATKLKYPVVLKPTNGYQGNGVFAGIQNKKEFKEALLHLRNDMGYKNVIVEKFVDGKEYRVFVIGDQVIGAVEKIQPSVYGDGKSSITELIRQKNKDKRKNPHLFRKPIKIDLEVKNCVKDAGYNLEDILEEDNRLYLRKKNSLSSGGDPVDATDELTEETKNTSIKALHAIPNLAQAGIDVMVDHKTNQAYIIEINAIAMIGSHLFPEIGTARDIPSAIIDYYFPETKEDERINQNVHFDLNSVLQPLINKTAEEVVVTPAPSWQDMKAVKYNVKGKVQKVGYRNWVRKKALEYGLYGYAQNLNNGTVDVVVAGTEENVQKFKEVTKLGPPKSKVEDVTETQWNKPVKVGFEVKEDQKPKKRTKHSQPVKSRKAKKVSLKTKIKKRLKKLMGK